MYQLYNLLFSFVVDVDFNNQIINQEHEHEYRLETMKQMEGGGPASGGGPRTVGGCRLVLQPESLLWLGVNW